VFTIDQCDHNTIKIIVLAVLSAKHCIKLKYSTDRTCERTVGLRAKYTDQSSKLTFTFTYTYNLPIGFITPSFVSLPKGSSYRFKSIRRFKKKEKWKSEQKEEETTTTFSHAPCGREETFQLSRRLLSWQLMAVPISILSSFVWLWNVS